MRGFPCSSVGKESACNAGDPCSIPRLGRSPGERNGNPLQYSCLENPMDKGALQAIVHVVARAGHDLVTKPSIFIRFARDSLINLSKITFKNYFLHYFYFINFSVLFFLMS